jgi:drug/metabolite transporter (DMT)-like permease
MTRILLVLLAGLILEAVGVVYVSRGMKQVGEPAGFTPAALVRYVGRIVTNRPFLIGLAFEAAFFATLVYLLAQRDVSLIWPLSGLSMVLTALSAWALGGEKISHLRWGGILLITLGALVVAWTERPRPTSAPDALAPDRKPVTTRDP